VSGFTGIIVHIVYMIVKCATVNAMKSYALLVSVLSPCLFIRNFISFMWYQQHSIISAHINTIT